MLTRRRIPLLLGPFGIGAVELQAERLALTMGDYIARAGIYHLEVSVGRRGMRPDLEPLGEIPALPGQAQTVALANRHWSALELLAEQQGMTLPQLLARAAIELAADLDSGRVATRIHAAGG